MEDYFIHVFQKEIQICSKKFLLINSFYALEEYFIWLSVINLKVNI